MGSLLVGITQLCVPFDLCMNTYELAVCKFHLDNMCRKEEPAPYASDVKTGLSLIPSRFSGSCELPISLPMCSQGQAAGLLCLSARD